MDATFVTASISAVVAVAGTVVTFVNRNKDSTDRRLEIAFNANQQLVDDLRLERTDLSTRVSALELAVEASQEDRRHLRETLSEQATQMYILRQRETELRGWAVEIMTWAAMAVGIIRAMGGTIDNPPSPPPVPPAAAV